MNAILEARVREINHRVSKFKEMDPATCSYDEVADCLKSTKDKRPESAWLKCLGVCQTCDSFKDGRCGLCGCLCRFKLFSNDWGCPGGKF